MAWCVETGDPARGTRRLNPTVQVGSGAVSEKRRMDLNYKWVR